MATVKNAGSGIADPHIPTKVLTKKWIIGDYLGTVKGILGKSTVVPWETGAVEAGEAPVNTVLPSLVDTTPTQGDVISTAGINEGTWTGDPVPTLTKSLRVGGVVKAMPYTILSGDVGSTVVGRVTANNGVGGDVIADSVASAAIVAADEAETTALLARFSVQPDSTRKALYNTLIKTLKDGGVWTRGYSLKIYASHDSQAATRNWLADLRNTTLVGTPTFTADRGYQIPGGTATALTENYSFGDITNVSLAGWVRNHTAAGCIIGSTNGRIVTTAGVAPATRCGDSTTSAPAHTVDSRLEYCCVSRSASGNYQSRVGTEEVTVSVAETVSVGAVESGRIGVAATSGITAQIMFSWIGQSLSKAQSDTLRSAVRTYLLAVGAIT